jgi:hypothetical protein
MSCNFSKCAQTICSALFTYFTFRRAGHRRTLVITRQRISLKIAFARLHTHFTFCFTRFPYEIFFDEHFKHPGPGRTTRFDYSWRGPRVRGRAQSNGKRKTRSLATIVFKQVMESNENCRPNSTGRQDRYHRIVTVARVDRATTTCSSQFERGSVVRDW